MGGVILDPNIKKESVRIDTNGNVIDPKTKQILQENKPDYVPTTVNIEPESTTNPIEVVNPVSGLPIKQQIIEAEAHLADLKVQRKAEIERMKAEIAELEEDE